MAINAVCPSCGNVHQLADTFSFKTVECSQCGTVFPTPGKKAPPPLPPEFNAAPKPIATPAPEKKGGPPALPPGFIPPAAVSKATPSPAVSGDYEVLPDEDDEPAPAPAEKWEVIEDEEADEPRPKTKPKATPKEQFAYEGDEADEEQEDERPQRRRLDSDDEGEDEPRPKSKMPMLLGLAAVLMFVIGGGAAAMYFFVLKDDEPVVAEKPLDNDAATKNVPPIEPKVIPNVEPKKQPKEEPKVEPKVEPKDEPKEELKVEPKVEPKKEPKKEPKEEPKKEPPFATGAVLVNAVEKARPIEEYKPAGDNAEILTGGVVKDVCAAGGGRYLLVNCADALKLHVVDVSTGKIAKTFPLKAPDALAAGGMDHFAVVYPGTKTIERFSLEKMASEATAKIDAKQKIIAVAMGSRTAGPVVLGGPQAQNNASGMALMFIDLPTLKEVEIEKAEGEMGVSFGTAANLRVSPNGQLLGAWFQKLNPSGLQTVQLTGNNIRGTYVKQSVGPVVPGFDGTSVYTEKGKFGPDVQNPVESGALIPAVTGKWVLQLETAKAGTDEQQFTKITVREDGKPDALAVFDNIPGFDGKKDPFQREINQMATDRRLWLIPEAKVLVTIPPSANKLQFFPVKAK